MSRVGQWMFQTGTCLGENDHNAVFLLGDYNRNGILDLFLILKQAGSNTEVHVLNGADNFRSFLLQTKTALHCTDETFEFGLGDYNRDGHLDLYAIKKAAASTEIHILRGSDNYQSFLLQTPTILHPTDHTFTFLVGDYTNDGIPDVYAIRKSGSKTTEVHVLAGKDNYQKWAMQTGTCLHPTGETFNFALGYFSSKTRPDIYAISKRGTGSHSTEVHVLKGDDNYQSFSLHTPTVLHETDETFEFIGGVYNKANALYAIKKKNGAGNKTEVHIMYLSDAHSPTSGNKGEQIASFARSKLGCRYVYGQEGPNTFDCSGLVKWCHQQVGIALPRTSSSQAAHPARASIANWHELQAGDVVFFHTVDSKPGVTHCGISLGGDQFIHAPDVGDVVKIATATPAYWKAPGRFMGGKRFW